jgi:hypothetical protein
LEPLSPKILADPRAQARCQLVLAVVLVLAPSRSSAPAPKVEERTTWGPKGTRSAHAVPMAGMFALIGAVLLLQRFGGTCLCENGLAVDIAPETVSGGGTRSHPSIQRQSHLAGHPPVSVHVSLLAAAPSPLGRTGTPSGPRRQAATRHASVRVGRCGAMSARDCAAEPPTASSKVFAVPAK